MKRKISKKSLRHDYPFTVDSGYICKKDGAIFFQAGNEKYAINGVAITKGYPLIDEIWADNPDIPGTKKTLSVIFDLI